jgi:hypothetical protein
VTPGGEKIPLAYGAVCDYVWLVMLTLTPTYSPADIFAFLIERVCGVVGLVGLRHGLTERLIALISGRIRRLGVRFTRLAERVHAGRLAAVCAACRRSASPRPVGSPDPSRVRPPSVLPRHRGWLVHWVPEADGTRDSMYWLLELPEMKELIAEAPQVGRIVRPLCRMLGVDMPTWLRLPRGARARTVEDASAPAPALARPQGADDGGWPQGRGPGLVGETEEEVWKFHRKKWA